MIGTALFRGACKVLEATSHAVTYPEGQTDPTSESEAHGTEKFNGQKGCETSCGVIAPQLHLLRGLLRISTDDRRNAPKSLGS
jgi:hypothetical protein